MLQRLFTKTFLDDFDTTISCFMNYCKIINNFLMDKCDIKHDTKCDIYVIAALKLNVQTKIEGSDREIRDGVVTP